MVNSFGREGIGSTAISTRRLGCTSQSGWSSSSLILMAHDCLSNDPVWMLNNVRSMFGRPVIFPQILSCEKIAHREHVPIGHEVILRLNLPNESRPLPKPCVAEILLKWNGCKCELIELSHWRWGDLVSIRNESRAKSRNGTARKVGTGRNGP